MKQFDLKEYNRRVAEGEAPEIVTRNGCKARIIATDRVHRFYPIIALVHDPEDEYEGVMSYTADGLIDAAGDKTNDDLFFVPRKKTLKGWVNVYKDGFGILCASKVDAKIHELVGCIKTIEISTEIEED